MLPRVDLPPDSGGGDDRGVDREATAVILGGAARPASVPPVADVIHLVKAVEILAGFLPRILDLFTSGCVN
jgi:hypothetical protein